MRGDPRRARTLWETALEISLESGNSALAASQMVGLAGLEFQQGDVLRDQETAASALDMAIEVKNAHIQVFALDAIASFTVDSTPAQAVRLAGAAHSLREAQGGGWTLDSVGVEDARSAASGALRQYEMEQAWAEGSAMSLDEAIEFARQLLIARERDAIGPGKQP